MRVLWVTNVVLSEFCPLYGIKQTYAGGWMTGLLNLISTVNIDLCFPIRDLDKVQNSEYRGHRFFSLYVGKGNVSYGDLVENALRVLDVSAPDIVHIWGTEFKHAVAFYDACKKKKIDKIVVDVQGIMGYLAYHMNDGIPRYWKEIKKDGYKSLLSLEKEYLIAAENEERVIQGAYSVLGRTTWDRVYAEQMNNNIRYFQCQRVLRREFYQCDRLWEESKCNKHTIFMSQGKAPHKGVHFMLEALPYILQRYPDTTVRIGGLSPIEKNAHGNVTSYGRYINHLIKKHGLMNNVFFVGKLYEEEMINEYLNANIFVSASSVENNSNSICEAQFLGTPVISSYVGGLGDIISDKNTGIFFAPGDIRMLAGCICDAFADPEKLAYLSMNGMKIARNRHNREKIVDTMQTIYKKVLDENGIGDL